MKRLSNSYTHVLGLGLHAFGCCHKVLSFARVHTSYITVAFTLCNLILICKKYVYPTGLYQQEVGRVV